jgi:hypothetical protein
LLIVNSDEQLTIFCSKRTKEKKKAITCYCHLLCNKTLKEGDNNKLSLCSITTKEKKMRQHQAYYHRPFLLQLDIFACYHRLVCNNNNKRKKMRWQQACCHHLVYSNNILKMQQ